VFFEETKDAKGAALPSPVCTKMPISSAPANRLGEPETLGTTGSLAPVLPPPLPREVKNPEPGAAPKAEGDTHSGGLTLWQMAMARFAGDLTAAVVTLVSLGLAVTLLGRRVRRQLESATVRVEFVNPSAVRLGPVAGQQLQEARGSVRTSMDPGPAERTLVDESEKKFDLGPTFEEEQRQAEEAQRQGEEAILQQIVEQNLALRRQMDEARLAPPFGAVPPPGEAAGMGDIEESIT